MADEAMSRDRQVRTEAVHAATRIAAAAVADGQGVDLGQWSHIIAHYIHAGVWLDGDNDGKVVCPYGDTCRFNRTAA